MTSDAKDRWLTPPPSWEGLLPGTVLPIHLTPDFGNPLRLGTGLHAVLTRILRDQEGHGPTADWSLLFVGTEQSSSGWAVWIPKPDDVNAIRGVPFEVSVRGRPCTFVAGMKSTARFRAPVVTEVKRHRVKLTTVTPVIIRASGKVVRPAPSTPSLWTALQNVANRIGLAIADPTEIGVMVVSHNTEPVRVILNQSKNLTTVGWMGDVYLDVNPLGRWLLEVAARLGLGGRNAYGFGRIELSPMNLPPMPPERPHAEEMVTDTAVEKLAERWNIGRDTALTTLFQSGWESTLVRSRQKQCDIRRAGDLFLVVQRVTMGWPRVLDVFFEDHQEVVAIDAQDDVSSLPACTLTDSSPDSPSTPLTPSILTTPSTSSALLSVGAPE